MTEQQQTDRDQKLILQRAIAWHIERALEDNEALIIPSYVARYNEITNELNEMIERPLGQRIAA